MPDPNIENRARAIESVISSGRPVSIRKRKWLDNYRAGRLKVYDHDTNKVVFYQPAPTGISLPTAPLTSTPVPTATPTPVPLPAPAIPRDRTALRSMAQLFTGNPDAEIRAPVRPDAPSSFLSQGVEGLQSAGEFIPFWAKKLGLTGLPVGPQGNAFGSEQSRALTELSYPLVARLLKTNLFSEEAAILRSQIAQINEQRPFMHQMANILDVVPLGAAAKFIKGLRGTKMATQASPPVTTELRLTRQAERPPPTLPPQPPSPRPPEEIQLDIDFVQGRNWDPGVKTDMLDSLHTELIQAASARPIGAAPIGARATQMALPAPAERLALPPSPARLALPAPAERLALAAPAERLALPSRAIGRGGVTTVEPGILPVRRSIQIGPEIQGWDFGGAAAVKAGSGTLRIAHVTDNPEGLLTYLRSRESLTSGRGPDLFGDLGQGLYGSDRPGMWSGRFMGKWSFVNRLTEPERLRFANALKEHTSFSTPGYLSDVERSRALDLLEGFKVDGESWRITELADQPYNIASWKPEFLQSVGIQPAAQPRGIAIELQGKFAELTRNITEAEAAQLRQAGYDGALVRQSMGTTAQTVVWNRSAITAVSVPTNLKTIGIVPVDPIDFALPAANVSPMPPKQTVPVPNSELLPQPAPFRVTKEGQALLPGQEIPSTPVKPRLIPPPEIPTNPRAGPDDPIPIIPPGAPATFAGQMPEEKADEILRWFADFLDSPENVEAWELTKIWRTAARSRRAAALQERTAELIDEGISYEGAMKKAIDESFSGKLPEATTSLPSVATPEVHDALFSKLYHVLAYDPFDRTGTFEALSNALMGKPIPRDPGVKGGSAFSRLQRVFPPKIMEALAENKQLAFQIGMRAARAPRPPARQYIPRDINPRQSGFDMPNEDLFVNPQRPLIEADPFNPPPLPIDLRSPLQRQFDLLDFTANIEGRPMSITNPNMYNIPEQGVLENPQQFRMFETPPVFQEPRPNPKTKVERDLDYQAYKILFADAPVGVKHIPGATDSDMLALEQLANWDNTAKRRALKAMGEAGWTAIDIGNFVRANMSSLDISWLRQGVLLIPSHPIKFTRAFADSFISLFSERWAQKVMKDIQAGPAHRMFYDKYNLDYLRPLDMKTLRKYGRVEGEPPHAPATRRISRAEGLSDIAEEYMALGGDRLIPRFTQKLPWIRMSGRAHVVGINKLTSSIFEQHYRNLLDINESRGFWGKFGTVLGKDAGAGFSIDENMRAVGRMLEDMSGRGPIPERLKGLTPAMNAGLFSLRLTLGRIRSPIHLFKGTRYSRLQAWRYMVTGVTSISSALFVGRELGLWDLETDSHSADFMKILFLDGRIRVDPWGGYQQYAVLLSRLATLSMKSSITGEITDSVDPIRLAAQFGKNKFSPGAAAILEAWVGEDFIGREIDRTDWLRWIRTRGPMAAMDIYETLGADGLMGTFKGSGAIIGGGVQVYDLPRWNDMDIYYNIKEGITAQDITERWPEYEPFFDIDNTSTILSDKQRRKAREQFRSDPWNEARLFVRNRVTTLSSEAAKGYAEELIDKYQISPRDIRGYEKYIQGDLNKSSKKQKELDSRMKDLISRIR
jgi:hypothetical protein